MVVGRKLDDIYMVMEYMEHDLKKLQESMKQPFSTSEARLALCPAWRMRAPECSRHADENVHWLGSLNLGRAHGCTAFLAPIGPHNVGMLHWSQC